MSVKVNVAAAVGLEYVDPPLVLTVKFTCRRSASSNSGGDRQVAWVLLSTTPTTVSDPKRQERKEPGPKPAPVSDTRVPPYRGPNGGESDSTTTGCTYSKAAVALSPTSNPLPLTVKSTLPATRAGGATH